ncbi:S1 family peptidase [Corynebacterium sp. sy017]|uniref:S1 family peptidase n=1 Tax=unclassified Corynebacterium TaxID=2624378 RepID=UPI0011848A26|nr:MULTISPECIES: S1 family peptidase [unclassified Corynebacterium]MBP3089136.1 S1 family peptidase [Corynebacterium sp. sy017]TSD91449.1 S1 family peptidase [Corynebacterium sp. SY003]
MSITLRRCAAYMTVMTIGAFTTFFPSARAMESTTFAPDNTESNAVVATQISDRGDKDGDCTGTAITPRWVITARHCVDGYDEDGTAKPSGSIRLGQGDKQYRVGVDGWYRAPEGDIALLHTTEDMKLGSYPQLAQQVPQPGSETVTYGWSPDGSGGTTRLPMAVGQLDRYEELSLYGGKNVGVVNLKGGAKIQPGDSGSPTFVQGRLIGVSTASPGDDADGKASQLYTSPVANVYGWIAGMIASDELPQDTKQQGSGKEKNPVKTPILLGSIAVLVCVFIGGVYVIRSGRENT